MPGQVHVTRAVDIKTSGGQTEGMIRQNAIVDVSDKVCSSGKTFAATAMQPLCCISLTVAQS